VASAFADDTGLQLTDNSVAKAPLIAPAHGLLFSRTKAARRALICTAAQIENRAVENSTRLLASIFRPTPHR
jgi:hypothetical protein